MAEVLVIGAGVIGLQTSITLAKAGLKVTVIAEHLPGDESIDYTSPWAGAIWRSHAKAEQKEDCEWDIQSYDQWMHVVERNREEAEMMGLLKCPITVFSETSSQPFYAGHVSEYRTSDSSKSLNSAHGHQFTSIAINPGTYLTYLRNQAQSYGVDFVQEALPTSRGLAGALLHAERILSRPLDELDVVINCTGLSAQRLCNDKNLFPIRGQTLLARIDPPLSQEILLWEAKDTVTYIVPRPGTDLFVLGGTKTRDNYDPVPTSSVNEDILYRCKHLLAAKNVETSYIDVVKEQVGLRPGRHYGKRVEVESLELEHGTKVKVIHNYGHAGTGYQASIGSAEKVLGLLTELLHK